MKYRDLYLGRGKMKIYFFILLFLLLKANSSFSQNEKNILRNHFQALQSISSGEIDIQKFNSNIDSLRKTKFNHKDIFIESLIKFKDEKKNEAFEILFKLKFEDLNLTWLDSVLFYAQIGQFYGNATAYVNAEKNLIKAKRILNRKGYSTSMINGWLIGYLVNTEKFNRALKVVKEELEKVEDKVPMLENTVYIYQCKNDWNNAEKYLRELKKELLASKVKFTDDKMYLYLYLGNNARGIGKINEALHYYQKVLEDTIGMTNWYAYIQANYQLAELYIKKNKFDSCALYLNNFFLCPCLDIETQSWLYQSKAEFYKKISDQKNYISNLAMAASLKDSVIGNMRNDYSKISELNNAQIDLIEENLKIMSNNSILSEQRSKFFLWMVIFLFIALLILFFYFKSTTKKNKQISEVNQQLAQSKIETMKANEEALLHKVKAQNHDLTQLAKNLTMKRDFEQKQKQIIKELLDTDQQNIQQELRKLYQQTNSQENINNHLHLLQIDIEKINSSFYLKMRETYPQLSQNDIEICALHLLNLDTKEIAAIKNVEAKSIQINRYRIKKKLELGPEEDLIRFLQDVIA